MSRSSDDRRNRERPVQASTIDRRHEKARKSVPPHPLKSSPQRDPTRGAPVKGSRAC
jgi:hypothetical protein